MRNPNISGNKSKGCTHSKKWYKKIFCEKNVLFRNFDPFYIEKSVIEWSLDTLMILLYIPKRHIKHLTAVILLVTSGGIILSKFTESVSSEDKRLTISANISSSLFLTSIGL